jgi:hypothetical protein
LTNPSVAKKIRHLHPGVSAVAGSIVAMAEVLADLRDVVGPSSVIVFVPFEHKPKPDLNVNLDPSGVSSQCDSGVCHISADFTVRDLTTVPVRKPFSVLVQAGRSSRSETLDAIAGNAKVPLHVDLPVGGNCFNPDCTIQITVDPKHRISEVDEANNQDSVTLIG